VKGDKDPPGPPPQPEDVEEKDETSINFGGNRVKLGTIIKALAIVLCLLFFLPLYTVSCGDVTVPFSGLDSTFGKTVTTFGGSENVPGNFLTLFLFLIPVALFSVFQFSKSLSFTKGKLPAISTGLSASGLLAIIIFAISINTQVSREGEGLLTLEYTFWYYLSVIIYIICSIVSYVCFMSIKKR